MRIKQLFAALMIASFVGACASGQGHDKQNMGAVIGAGLGALTGSQVGSGKGKLAAVALGALAGAWAGSELGKSLDKADQMYAERTTQDSLERSRTGQQTSWSNPDSGHGGTVTPHRTYKIGNNDCRDYETTVTIDGRTERAMGRACRQQGGTWRIIR